MWGIEITKVKNDISDTQLALAFDDDDDTSATSSSSDQKSKKQRRIISKSDEMVLNAIRNEATKRGTQLLPECTDQWIIQLGYKEIMDLTGLSRKSVQRSVKHVIEHGCLTVYCPAKNGTEATIYVTYPSLLPPECGG